MSDATTTAPIRTARLAGALYLAINVCGIFSGRPERAATGHHILRELVLAVTRYECNDFTPMA